MANNMKDRLIELKIQFVENFNCGDCKLSNNKCKECLTEKEADFLLANGVVVVDNDVVSPENRPLIQTVVGVPINEVIELVKAKQQGRIIAKPCTVGDRGLTMAEMSHCYGCGAYIPELLIDDNNKVNFRCTKCGCETRPQNTLDEAEKLWNEGRTYPHNEKKFWSIIERKINNG